MTTQMLVTMIVLVVAVSEADAAANSVGFLDKVTTRIAKARPEDVQHVLYKLQSEQYLLTSKLKHVLKAQDGNQMKRSVKAVMDFVQLFHGAHPDVPIKNLFSAESVQKVLAEIHKPLKQNLHPKSSKENLSHKPAKESLLPEPNLSNKPSQETLRQMPTVAPSQETLRQMPTVAPDVRIGTAEYCQYGVRYNPCPMFKKVPFPIINELQPDCYKYRDEMLQSMGCPKPPDSPTFDKAEWEAMFGPCDGECKVPEADGDAPPPGLFRGAAPPSKDAVSKVPETE